MRHYNIFGDETSNPDEFLYCTACKQQIDGEWNYYEGECKRCGATLDSAESIITGAMMRDEREALDRREKEWIALNAPMKAKP